MMSVNDTEVVPQNEIDAACLKVADAVNALSAAYIANASPDVYAKVSRARHVLDHMVDGSGKRYAPPRRPTRHSKEDHGSQSPVCA